MYIVIVGGGKVGYYLTKTLLAEGHEVTLVERNHEKYERLEREFGSAALRANGSTPDGLAQAGCSRANVVVALTGMDETNLVICQLARQLFGVQRTIARINNPKNEAIFRALGAGITVSSTAVIAGLIEQEVESRRISTLLTFAAGEMTILELDLDEGCAACGKTLEELPVPPGNLIVAVLRGEKSIIPDGRTRLQAGDRVIAVSQAEHTAPLRKVLLGPEES